MIRNFSKKVFLVFVTSFIFLVFQNIVRLNKSENIFLGVQKIDNKYILNEKNENQSIKIYHPDVKNNSINGWQGRLCWNTPFICSYYKLEVRKKNGYLLIKRLKTDD